MALQQQQQQQQNKMGTHTVTKIQYTKIMIRLI